MRPGFLERLFGAALIAFPSAHRRRFGDEMQRSFAQLVSACRAAGGQAAARRLAFRAVLDAVRCGIALRFEARAMPTRPAPQRRPHPTMIDSLRFDLRHALRSLRRSPAFSVAAIVVLALGIGANSAMFSALRATMLQAPPYPDPDRLLLVDLEFPLPDRAEPEIGGWSYPKFRTLLEQPDLAIEDLAGYSRRVVALAAAGGDAERVDAELVTPRYFRVLGATPHAGRLFVDDKDGDAAAEARLTTVLGHAFWQRRFGGDPDIVGAQVRIGGRPVEVVGVLEPGFRGLTGRADLWLNFSSLPALVNPRALQMKHAHWFEAVGRLAPGVTLDQLDTQLDQVSAVLDRVYPDSFYEEPIGVGARSLADARRNPNAERSLLLLSIAAIAIVLIACGNVAALFESRADGRRRAISIRSALGATRGAVVRAMMIEATVLAVAGGLLGLALARWLVTGLAYAWPASFRQGSGFIELTHLDGLSLGPSGALFALIAAVLVAMLFGLGPAVRLSRQVGAPQDALRGSDLTDGRGRGLFRSRAVLVGAQTALAVVLVIGAGLMITSLLRLGATPIGARAEGLVAFEYEIARSSQRADAPLALHRTLLERLQAMPGVTGVTFGHAPLSESRDITLVTGIDGAPPKVSTDQPEIGFHRVADGHFRLLDIPVLAGRGFGPGDRADGAPVVVLSKTAARTLYGDPVESAIGRQISLGMDLTSDGESAEVIGVVGDVLYGHPSDGLIAEAYSSYRQSSTRYQSVLVRTDGEPLALVGDLRSLMTELDPDLPIFGLRTLSEIRRAAIGDTRMLTTLLLGSALLALTLAAIGTYGVTSYWVAGRRREMGVRIALGARSLEVQKLVVGRGLKAVAIGIVVGTAGALAATRIMTSLLFEVESRDPLTFITAILTLLVVTFLASYLPARRASRVDPVAVLSDE